MAIIKANERVVDYLNQKGIDWEFLFIGDKYSIYAYIRNFHEGKDARIGLERYTIGNGYATYTYPSNRKLDKLFKAINEWDFSEDIRWSDEMGYEEIFISGDNVLKEIEALEFEKSLDLSWLDC